MSVARPLPEEDGYHWFRHAEGTNFVALREGGRWWLPGLGLDVRSLDRGGSRYLGPAECPYEED